MSDGFDPDGRGGPRPAGGEARAVRGPNDPGRRDRIVDATLDVIADAGVTGTSHRRVADAAGVPLGSMTYYFDGMHELLHEAFTRFATAFSDRFDRRLRAARTRAEARDAVVTLIADDVFDSQRDLVLAHELYTLAARDPSYRDITNAWMGRSRAALERHFDAATVRILDALIEGLTIHRALDTEPQPRVLVEDAVDRILRTDHRSPR